MENKGPAAFKYKVSGGGQGGRVAMLVVSLALSIVGMAHLSPWFGLGLLIPLWIIVRLVRAAARKNLIIAPRYLIVGNEIIYYAAVTQARLDRRKQTLTLQSERGRRVTVEAERFPTNARKAEKIRINRTGKFEKAVEKILQRLPGVTPDVVG